MRSPIPVWLLIALAAGRLAAAAPPGPYDPARNAARDIEEATVEARRAHKRVLLEVGGNWCPWCRGLERIFQEHPDLAALRDKGFVTVKTNFSEQNRNKEVLSRYPKIPAYPHFFVLDAEGKLLHSQKSTELGAGKSWDLQKLSGFLKQWAP